MSFNNNQIWPAHAKPTLFDLRHNTCEFPSLGVSISKVNTFGHVGAGLRVTFIDNAFKEGQTCKHFVVFGEVSTYMSIEALIHEALGSIYLEDLVLALRDAKAEAPLLGAAFKSSTKIWVGETMAISYGELDSAQVFAFCKISQLEKLTAVDTPWTLRHVCRALAQEQYSQVTWEWNQAGPLSDKEYCLGTLSRTQVMELLRSMCHAPQQWHTRIEGTSVTIEYAQSHGYSFELSL